VCKKPQSKVADVKIEVVYFGMLNRFPTDRVNNFCDAVFAIAMTLLILEIKIPNLDDLKTNGTWGVLARLIPSFVGFLISFLVTALYWRAHLIIAQFVKSYDNRLLWITVWLLMSVVLLPFSTAFYSKYSGFNGPFVVYCINLVMIGLFNFIMVNCVVQKEGYSESLTPILAARLRFRAIVAPAVWGLSAAWVFVEPYSARMLFLLIFVILAIVERRFDRKERLIKEKSKG
jgi:uncharacterized membrane protein